MKKRLLFAMALALTTFTASFALEVGDKVYTANACYKVTGENNLLANGSFTQGDTFLDGWYALVEGEQVVTPDFTVEDTGEGFNSAKVKEFGESNGMYAVCPISEGKAYVVSMKIRNLSLAGTTTTGTISANCNYLNVLLGQNIAEATTLGSSVAFDGEWNMVYFAVPAQDEAQNVYIKFAAMAEGFEVADVQVQAASEAYDMRKAVPTLNYAKAILDGYDWQQAFDGTEVGTDPYDGVAEMIEIVEGNAENDEVDMETANSDIDGLAGAIEEMLAAYTEDIYETASLKFADNNTPNWDFWNTNFNRGNLTSRGGWTFTGGSWGNRFGGVDPYTGNVWATAANGGVDPYIEGKSVPQYAPIYVTYQWGIAIPYSTATLPKTLPAGKYIIGVDAMGGRMNGSGTQQYVVNNVDECMNLQLFIENDTCEAIKLSPAEYNTYVKFGEVTESGDNKVGYIVYADEDNGTKGGKINLTHPTLRRIREAGQLTIEQTNYIAAVKTQLEAANNAYKASGDLYADEQYPWQKQQLLDTMDIVKPLIDAYAAYTQADILASMSESPSLSDKIMNECVRPLQYFNRDFQSYNEPVTKLAASILDANTLYNNPANAEGDKATYEAIINEAEALYTKAFDSMTGEESDVTEIQNMMDELVTARKAFQLSAISLQNPVDIIVKNGDFATKNATGWTLDGSNQTDNGRLKYEATTNFTDGYTVRFDRGYTAYSRNKISQTVEVEDPGLYVMTFEAYAYNCNQGYDDAMKVFKLNEETGEEELDYYDTHCYVFFGPNAVSDPNLNEGSLAHAVRIHKDPNAANLNGEALCTSKGSGGSYQYSCPADPYSIPYVKEGSDVETLEFGATTMSNGTVTEINTNGRGCNNFGFGSVHIYYFGNHTYEEYISTGVLNVNDKVELTAPKGIFSISGAKLSAAPAKGVYIIDGKKYVK